MKKVYLAGPDVFAHNATELSEQHKKLCTAHGFQPLHPADATQTTAKDIYNANIALIKSADAVLANLNPFRGAEADSGTAFEVGFAIALGLPVIGYVDGPTTVLDQVKKFYGPIYLDEEQNKWLDQNENLVENFDLPMNLMLAESCEIIYGGLLEAIIQLQRRWYD
ncbi:nucleoside 2-deoxyribosyltransferase [Paenalcaligenes faecalis]|uniref:nucleoside 2-deoxyribosyltransferase n=1 Tax=Paenalcaligenes faecalis TaxID=2980099 RepID=UPI0022B98030|nr:nucleoside 2-deoxyribosyltransferase [Paenalcaligenes faecalis]